MGINKKPNISGSKTIYIKNSINMGWVFDFSRSFLDNFRELGYLDTKRVLGALKGEKYFFCPDEKAEKSFETYIKSDTARKILDFHISDSHEEQLNPRQKIRKILPESMKQRRELLYCLADCAATIFNVDQIHEYTLEELAETIRRKKSEDDERIATLKQEITNAERISLEFSWNSSLKK